MLKNRSLLTLILGSLGIVLTLGFSLVSNDHLRVSLFNEPVEPLFGRIYESLIRIDPQDYGFDPGASFNEELVYHGTYGEWSFCEYEAPLQSEEEGADKLYDVNLLSVDMTENIQAGEVFIVTMELENTGTARVYSEDSGCPSQTVLNLGTAKSIDRHSVFGTEDYALTGWSSPSRVKMKDTYADPGDTFTIQFQSKAPDVDTVYREFFQTVIEGKERVGEAFILDIPVGEVSDEDYDNIQYVLGTSIEASALRGLQRNIEIELSTQMLTAKFGDIEVWDMQVSSGHWETPTPRGIYKIFQKQELRVGGQAPHYRMPYWMFWESSGYGIHGLPYLGDPDSGWFWEEAASHLGIPVSHGCIRVGDDDVKRLYEFSPIGTPVYIY
jgi:hypothetical protein